MTAILTICMIQLVILVKPTGTDSIPSLTHRSHQLIVAALESLGSPWLVIVICLPRKIEGSEQLRAVDVAFGGCQLVVHVDCWGLRGCECHVYLGSLFFFLVSIEGHSTERTGVCTRGVMGFPLFIYLSGVNRVDHYHFANEVIQILKVALCKVHLVHLRRL